MKVYNTASPSYFPELKSALGQALLDSPLLAREQWQRMKVKGSDAHQTHEMSNVIIQMAGLHSNPQMLGDQLKPDLPWAEDHFAERVGGEPINPGKAHAYWPYHGASMQQTLRSMGEKGEHYDHNYMERMWARQLTMSTLETERVVLTEYGEQDELYFPPFTGYRFDVGDLGSVVELLRNEPTTRQAFLPIWFPEDTGVTSGQRVPCTIGYHFILMGTKLNMTYFLRACEWRRHFTNDVYLAIRLQQWVAEQIGGSVELGEFVMHVSNMHLFKGDRHYVGQAS